MLLIVDVAYGSRSSNRIIVDYTILGVIVVWIRFRLLGIERKESITNSVSTGIKTAGIGVVDLKYSRFCHV